MWPSVASRKAGSATWSESKTAMKGASVSVSALLMLPAFAPVCSSRRM